MIKNFFIFLMLMSFFSCKEKKHWERRDISNNKVVIKDTSLKLPDTVTIKKLGFYTLINDSVLIPPFDVEVSLTPKAKNRIVSGNEKIVVFVSLNGTPKDSSKANLEEDGLFYVASATKQVSYGETARFDDMKFSKKIYDELADKDPELTINVFSGRVSSQNNLLDVDFFSDKVSNVINKHVVLKGKLIYGDDSK